METATQVEIIEEKELDVGDLEDIIAEMSKVVEKLRAGIVELTEQYKQEMGDYQLKIKEL